MARPSEVDGSRPIEEGALYLVRERLETFKDSSWPFDSGSCTPQKMAEAGFYYCGTPTAPDWTRCVVCHVDMDGWEATDDPLYQANLLLRSLGKGSARLDGWEATDDPSKEHKSNRPKCQFLKLKDPYAITVGEVLDLERAALQHCITIEAKKFEADMKGYVDEVREKLESMKDH